MNWEAVEALAHFVEEHSCFVEANPCFCKAGINAGCKTALLSDNDENYGQTETVKSLGEFVSRMM